MPVLLADACVCDGDSCEKKRCSPCVLGASSTYIITVTFRSTLLYEPLMQCWHELSVLAIPVSIDLFFHVQNEVYFTLEHRNYVMYTFIALWFDSRWAWGCQHSGEDVSVECFKSTNNTDNLPSIPVACNRYMRWIHLHCAHFCFYFVL